MMISLSLLPLAGEKNHVIKGLLSLANEIVDANIPNKYKGLLENKNINSDLIEKIIMAESSGNPNAVNKKSGAKGLMQITDATADDPGFNIKPLKDPFDPIENVRFGTEYFNALMKRYDNDTVSALAAYNYGLGNIDKWRKKGSKFDELPAETQNYINTILN